MTRRKLPISTAGLPSFETTPLWCRLDDDVELGLAAFPSVLERASVGLRFLQQEGGTPESMGVRPEELERMQAGYLRAALMEFVGMEDSLPLDLRSAKSSKPPLRIYHTGSAMLILLKELRNIHIHVSGTKFQQREQPAILRGPDQVIETTFVVRTIPRADLDRIMDGRSARHFNRHELEAAISWLDTAQYRWGFHDVVQAAINAYGRAILARHASHAA